MYFMPLDDALGLEIDAVGCDDPGASGHLDRLTKRNKYAERPLLMGECSISGVSLNCGKHAS
jgi:hypothetical protein